MYQFEYVRPQSLAEAVSVLQAGDGNAQLLAGGQTLLPTMKQRLNAPSHLVDLSAIEDLRAVSADTNTLTIGAMTSHAAVAANTDVRKAIPTLAKLAGGIGDPQVRNLGTIGGSLANNDPAADYPAAALALGATIRTDRREISADDYFQGFFTTALEEDEIIVSISFPIPEFAGYGRFEQRASRYPLVGVFVARTAGEVRVAVTGAGQDGVFRASEIEAALAEEFSAAALNGIRLPHDDLLSDLHGSNEYRAALITVMAQRAIEPV